MGASIEQIRVGPDLLLRGPREADLEAMVEHCRDPEMIRWTTVPTPYERAHAEEFLAAAGSGWADGSAATFTIEYRGRYAGGLDVRMQEASWADVGYSVASWARGQGVMRRSLDAVLDWGFAERSLSGVQWKAHVGNEASRRVALACGFRLEGTVRGLLVQRGRRVDAWIGTLLPGDRRNP